MGNGAVLRGQIELGFDQIFHGSDEKTRGAQGRPEERPVEYYRMLSATRASNGSIRNALRARSRFSPPDIVFFRH